MIQRFFVILTCMVLVFPVLAQDLSDEEQGYLDEIIAAMDATFLEETFRMEGEQIMNQYLEFGDSEMTQEIIQVMMGNFITLDDGQNAHMIVEQEISQETDGTGFEIELTMGMLANDEGLYIQVSDVSPAELVAIYPDDWILLDDSAASQYEGLAFINAEQMNQLMDARQLATPMVDINEVAGEIEVLDDEEINGVETNVYRVTASAELVFSDEYMDTITDLFNLGAMGIDPSILDFEVDEDALIQYAFYIGQEDGLLYRIEAIVDMTMIIDGAAFGTSGDFVIDQQLIGGFSFFDFGEAIKLPKP